MKKFISVLILSLSTQVFAVDWSLVKGGALGYLDSIGGTGLFGSVQVFWYSTAGEKLAIKSFPMDSTTSVHCSVANFDNPSEIIASGITSGATDMIPLSISSTGLYLVACLKNSGASGTVIIGVFKEEFFK